jgi:hypothetical protein
MRLVDTVESLFRPSPKEEIAQRERAAQVRANEETGQTKVALAGRLVRLQQQLSAGAASADLSGELQKILNALVPETAATEPDAPPAGTVAVGNIPIVGDPASPAASSEDGDAGSDDSGSTATVSASAGDGDAPVADSPAAPAAG